YDEEPEYEEEYVSGDVGVSLVVRRSCLTPKADGDNWLRHNIFQSTCTISGKVCTFVCDSGSCDNLIAAEAVQKLELKTEEHPKPYKLQPREYGRAITYNGRDNTYSFLFEGVKITLMPNKPKEIVSKSIGALLTLSQFEEELEVGDDVFVLIGKEVAEDSEIPKTVIPLLKEFSDIFPDELPDGLPPLRDIQHHIDLEPSSQLPNRPHYRMSPGEHEELRRQVEELVSKGHVRESMSPCVVPALLTPKRDGTWQKINPNAYHLKLPSHIRCSDVFNVKHLVPYYGDSSDDDLAVNLRTNFVYPGENDAGLSVEERAELFLEAQDRVKEKA
nr:putative reverse transcriptase domain-containing protein [Tanacetum cinerariifolium]